jgi:hypothetical protein
LTRILEVPSMNSDAQITDPYVQRLLTDLGDRDPISVLETSVREFEALIAGIADHDIRRREQPGRWSIIQVLSHLADSEVVQAYRLRMVLAHDKPTIQAYDQDAWATRLRYDETDPTTVLSDLRTLRAANLRLVRSLSGEERSRIGLHEERGPESISHMLRLLAGHDIFHLRQVRRIIETLQLSAPQQQ